MMQWAFVAWWCWTLQPALYSFEWLAIRTVGIMAYWTSQFGRHQSGTVALICELMTVMHVLGLVLAVMDRDSRIFKHRKRR
jgi:hypothetical protein